MSTSIDEVSVPEPRSADGNWPTKLTRGLISAGDMGLAALAIVLVWQSLHWIAGEFAIASPWTTAVAAVEMIGDARFWPHVAETMTAFGLGLLCSLVGGLLIGVMLGANKLSAEVSEPILIAFYSLPKIALYPVILLFFGLGMSSKVVFGAIFGIFPVIIFTMNALQHINVTYLRTARVLRLGRLETARRVLVPATIPEIFSGFRLGFSLTLMGTLVGELFASQRGLGYLIMQSMETHDVPQLMALALVLFIAAATAGWVLLVVDRRLYRRV